MLRGGKWTKRKLQALQNYMNAYMTLMKDKPSPAYPFRKIYFDAFCGSGGRLMDEAPILEGQQIDAVLETSPRSALAVKPPFDSYLFCDYNKSALKMLREVLKKEGFDLTNCSFVSGDANEEIVRFCRGTDWRSTRAVMFLDPYGLQVKWSTLEAIAATKGIDLWYLFPAGLGPLRMTPRSGDVPKEWARKLTTIWGDDSWEAVAYERKVEDADLFGMSLERIDKVGNAEDFERAFIGRLKSIFGGVASTGLRLYNSRGSHMFSLLFACANDRPQAYKPALKIANHIIRMPGV